MHSDFIKYGRSAIHYIHYGNGPITLVCLHGYGEGAGAFNFLHKYLSTEYCIIAIDLPYHGTTAWKEERSLTNADLASILEEIFKVEGITDETFILIGYSMGGRIALSLVEFIPHRISRLILLAPDGMTVNFWYWLATQTITGNHLFRFTMNHPRWFLGILNVSDRFRLLSKSFVRFIKTYTDDENFRKLLFHRWTCMRTFKPDLHNIRNIIQQQQLPVRMVYGEHDHIVLSKRADKFRQGLESMCQVHVIDAGHQVLQGKYAMVIVELLTR